MSNPREQSQRQVLYQEVSDEKADDDADDDNHSDYDRNQPALKYCQLLTRYPKTAFAVTLGCHLSMFVMVVLLVYFGFDVFPVNFKTFPLDIRDSKYYLRGLAWDFRDQNEEIIKRGILDTEIQPERSETLEVISWIYYHHDNNVLKKSNLLLMQEVENGLFNNSAYQSDFCRRKDNSTCVKPVSILRFFDGTYKELDDSFLDPEFDNVELVLYKASYYNETKILLNYHLDVSSRVTPDNCTASAVRSHMNVGYPLHGYTSTSDRTAEQKDKMEEFLKTDFVPQADDYFRYGVGQMDFFYESRSIIFLYVNENVATDMLLANGSFCFIFFFMWLQTGSLWVTGFAVLSILTSFCTANLIYRFPLDFQYFGVFHVLSLFIILGIGADDVFVFFDIWKQSALVPYKSLAHRLSDCYHRAALAMLYTSLTTTVAFVVSATSPFLAVYTFGIFTGILVIVNYFSVIIYFPCVVVTYHLYFERFKCCCCCENELPESSENDTAKISVQSKSRRRNALSLFFGGPYYRFVTHKVMRWIILTLFTASVAVFIYFATQLQVNEEQIKFLPDDTNVARYLKLRANVFSTVDAPVSVYVVFGMEQQDLSPCHRTDSQCVGSTVWDDTMDLNSNASQLALIGLCDKLKSMPSDSAEELFIRRSLVTGELEVSCFLDDMKAFLQTQTNLPEPVVPVTKSLALTLMESSPQVYNTSLLPSNYNNWFEMVSSYWLYGGFQGDKLPDYFAMYNGLLGEAQTNDTISTQIGDALTYKYGTELKYAAIVVNTMLNPRSIGYIEGQVVREKWESLISTEVAKMPAELQGGFQTTSRDSWIFSLWHWLEIQETLAWSAVIGLVTGLSLALPILIVATMNLYVGLLATLTLCCITVSVVGVIPMAGWKLGVLESLNLVLVVGLAVDYCVHLAVSYSRAPYLGRRDRLRYSLREMGVSVLSGCCSTLGASIFLMFAHILFFTQFGSVMFCTIGFSILYALVFFTTVLGVVGPEGEQGSLRKLCVRSKCCRTETGRRRMKSKESSSV